MATKQKGVCFLGFWLLILTIGLSPRLVQADDASLGAVGYGVVPLDNDQIEMVSETVEVWLHPSFAEVEATFNFHNTSDATEVLMGFPQRKEREGREGFDVTELQDFKAYVDGEEVEVTFKKQTEPQEGLNFAGWHTFAVPFEPDQTRTVRNTYRGRLTYLSDGTQIFDYVLGTGRLWKGPIGQVDIVVHLQDGLSWENFTPSGHGTFHSRVEPSGYRLREKKIVWHFEDIEPAGDRYDITINLADTQGFRAFSPIPAPLEREQLLYALDGDPRTTWVPRRQEGGQWILWADYPGLVARGERQKELAYGLGILPGYVFDPQLFEAYSRPREIKVFLAIATEKLVDWTQLQEHVDIDGGPQAYSQLFDTPLTKLVTIGERKLILDDEPRMQYLWFDEPLDLVAAKLVVESVYSGNESQQMAITDLAFPLEPKAWASTSAATSCGWYTPNFVLDLDLSTAWVSADEGIGEWLEVELPAPRWVSGIAIAADTTRFAAYSRVHQASLVFSDGSRQRITLADTQERQTIRFAPVSTSTVRLIVEDTYPGASGQVAISEVQLLTSPPSNLPATGGNGSGYPAFWTVTMVGVALMMLGFMSRTNEETGIRRCATVLILSTLTVRRLRFFGQLRRSRARWRRQNLVDGALALLEDERPHQATAE